MPHGVQALCGAHGSLHDNMHGAPAAAAAATCNHAVHGLVDALQQLLCLRSPPRLQHCSSRAHGVPWRQAPQPLHSCCGSPLQVTCMLASTCTWKLISAPAQHTVNSTVLPHRSYGTFPSAAATREGKREKHSGSARRPLPTWLHIMRRKRRCAKPLLFQGVQLCASMGSGWLDLDAAGIWPSSRASSVVPTQRILHAFLHGSKAGSVVLHRTLLPKSRCLPRDRLQHQSPSLV